MTVMCYEQTPTPDHRFLLCLQINTKKLLHVREQREEGRLRERDRKEGRKGKRKRGRKRATGRTGRKILEIIR